MRSYFILFSLSLLVSLSMTPLVRRWALRWGAVDLPDGERHIHKQPTPRLGGVVLYSAFLLALLCSLWLGNRVSENLLANWQTVAIVMAAATLVFALGIYDDIRGANVALKVTVQLMAAILLYFCGFRISTLSSPFGGSWELPMLLNLPLTALWIVGITNAFNLIDGIDGLAAGASAFALLSLFIFSLAQGHPEVSLMSIILVGAVIGFLRYNFNPARIFLGDSGSLLLGFMAAALSLIGTQKSPTLIAITISLVSFGLPVTEVGLSLSRRFLSGAPLFQGDLRHIHHMLLSRGLTQRQAVILLYAICALFSLFGIMLLNPQRYTAALIFFVLGVGMVIGVQHLRYAEFNVLGRQIKQGITRQRRAVVFNVHLRHVSDELRLTQTVEQMLTALTGLCTALAFDRVTLELHQLPSTTAANLLMARPLALIPGTGRTAWTWYWNRGGAAPRNVPLEHQCWILRAPLIDGQGTILGAITFYCDKPNDILTINPTQICDPLCLSLCDALQRLNYTNHSQFGSKPQQAVMSA